MRRIFFYKLTTDNGGAPCIKNGLLSLSICKPIIRTSAEVEDLVLGFAANSLYADNRIIYVARITHKELQGQYYVSAKYVSRGDRIYKKTPNGYARRKGAQYHDKPQDLTRDLGSPSEFSRATVLLGKDFRYFGANGNSEYKKAYPEISKAIGKLGQGHRVRHDEPLLIQLQQFKQEIWRQFNKKVLGESTSAPSASSCHRGKSWGVVREC